MVNSRLNLSQNRLLVVAASRQTESPGHVWSGSVSGLSVNNVDESPSSSHLRTASITLITEAVLLLSQKQQE